MPRTARWTCFRACNHSSIKSVDNDRLAGNLLAMAGMLTAICCVWLALRRFVAWTVGRPEQATSQALAESGFGIRRPAGPFVAGLADVHGHYRTI